MAAESNAPIILTGINGAGAAAETNVQVKLAKLGANAVVTALGGNKVVPDSMVMLVRGVIDSSEPLSFTSEITPRTASQTFSIIVN